MDMPLIAAGPIAVSPYGAPMSGGEDAFAALLDALLPSGSPLMPDAAADPVSTLLPATETAGPPAARQMPNGAEIGVLPTLPMASWPEALIADAGTTAEATEDDVEPSEADLQVPTDSAGHPTTLPATPTTPASRFATTPALGSKKPESASAEPAATPGTLMAVPKPMAARGPFAVPPAATPYSGETAPHPEGGGAVTPAVAQVSSPPATSGVATAQHADPQAAAISPTIALSTPSPAVSGFPSAAASAAAAAPSPPPKVPTGPHTARLPDALAVSAGTGAEPEHTAASPAPIHVTAPAPRHGSDIFRRDTAHPDAPGTPAVEALSATLTPADTGFAQEHAPMQAPRSDTPAPATRPATPPIWPARQIAPFAIALALGPDASLTVTLDPAELGRVEVAIERSGAEARINVTAERPETLMLLQRDRAELERALAAAGFGNGSGGPALSFGGAGADGQRQRHEPRGAPRAARPEPAATPDRPGLRSLLDLAI